MTPHSKNPPKPRLYQQNIFNNILLNGNTLVILPTGLGKTLIAFMLILNKLKEGRCLFLAPTKPLTLQHYENFINYYPQYSEISCLITGSVKKEKRAEHYSSKKVFFATPQTIKNDIESNILDLSEFSLIIFDEAHKAVGDYAYVFISKHSNDKTLLVGLTASPGGTKERINEIINNLKIQHIELKTPNDQDIKPYIKKTDIKWLITTLPNSFKQIKSLLEKLISDFSASLTAMGFPPPLKHKAQFIKLREKILSAKSEIKFPAIITYSMLLNTLHMLELLETQGIHSLKEYLIKLETKTSKSVKALLRKPEMVEIKKKIFSTTEEHPKINLLVNLLKKLEGKKSIIFVQYRDQISFLEKFLNEKGFSARMFVGKGKGFGKKKQEETLSEFREGKFNILIASSVGEEGLDIPSVDVVIFYEPVPSEIRTIQRRGRAGRLKYGEIYILLTKNTRDEYFYWSSVKKEKRMKEIILSLNLKKSKKMEITKDGIYKLTNFF